MSLLFHRAGLQTTVQDFGRPGLRHRGIPECGAADRLSLIAANRAVGVADENAALEITLIGPEIEFGCDMRVAYAGAQAELELNGKSVPPFQSISVKAGDRLLIGTLQNGVRGYLALSHEISANEFSSSKSTYMPAGLGGYEGRAIKDGDKIGLGNETDSGSKAVPIHARTHLCATQILRVMPGPEWEWLTKTAQKRLLSKPWTAHAQTDRMGARLTGPKLALSNKKQLVSAGLLPGTVQIPQGGAPILSLVDSHCTGGYARAFKVIRADMHRLGHIGPGTKIWFRRCEETEAREALRILNLWLSV